MSALAYQGPRGNGFGSHGYIHTLVARSGRGEKRENECTACKPFMPSDVFYTKSSIVARSPRASAQAATHA